MGNLPAWALWIITAAVGLSPGLAFFMIGMISRSLWPRSKETLGPERARDEAAIAVPLG